MLLTFDIGNTNITLGAWEEESLLFTARLATDTKRMEDQYAVEIRDILDINGVWGKTAGGAVIASVVPPLTTYIARAVEKLTGITPFILGPGIKTGLNIKIDNPSQLGADFVAVSVAAMANYPCPNVVCDLGTATTLSVLDSGKNMIGCVILAGVRTGLDALVSGTALLQQVSFEAPKHVIGKNTVQSLQSGMVFGTAAALDGIIDRIETELGEKVTAIATGGQSPEIIKHCKRDFIYSENLVLEGLRMIYLKNI